MSADGPNRVGPAVRRSTAALLIVVSLAVSYYLDRTTGVVPDLTVLYLVPIVIAVSAYGLTIGLPVAVFALVALGLAHPVIHWSALAVDTATHFAIFLFAAIAVDRLRHQLAVTRDLSAQRDFDLDLARRVEEQLQRPSLTDRRFEIASALRFAREVGGDYLRLEGLGDGMFVCVGDISGKGVAAALFATLLDATITDALAAYEGLASLVEAVNARMYASMPDDMFVTMLFAVFSDDGLSYVNAGHVPPLVLRAASDKVMSLADAGIPPLAVSQRVEPDPGWLPLAGGDVVLIVTDGVTESRALREDPELLVRYFQEAASRGPKAVVDRATKLAEQAGALTDDVTVVCVRRLLEAGVSNG